MVVPTSPALTRLSSGGLDNPWRKPKTDVRTLPQCGSLEPLGADKLGVVHETGYPPCGSGVALPFNIAEGREPEPSVWLHYTPGLVTEAQGCCPRKGARCGCRTRARLAADVPSASAFLCWL
jgi:hypothetical protein